MPFYLALLIFACSSASAYGQPSRTSAPCPKVVGLLVTRFVYGTPVSKLPRVEIRQCGDGSEALQIVAWEAQARRPSLVVDTTDFTVVQMAARGSSYVIETTGGSRNRIFVITYNRGKPLLAVRRITKGTATLKLDSVSLEIVIDGIYAGDAEPRKETHVFKLND